MLLAEVEDVLQQLSQMIFEVGGVLYIEEDIM